MKLRLKDEPKEWRKSALLLALGLALLASLLCWRQHLAPLTWLCILAGLAAAAIAAIVQPRWFRGYHLFSMRLGFIVSGILGRTLLFLFFVFIVTPLGLALRLAGKDPLQLRRSSNAETYWCPAKDPNSLDRLF
jgi:hypothetical protein